MYIFVRRLSELFYVALFLLSNNNYLWSSFTSILLSKRGPKCSLPLKDCVCIVLFLVALALYSSELHKCNGNSCSRKANPQACYFCQNHFQRKVVMCSRDINGYHK